MTHVGDDDLFDAVLGVPPTPSASAHLSSCADCRRRMVLARRTIEALRNVGQVSLERPPERVWSAIADELRLSADAAFPGPGRDASRGLAGARPADVLAPDSPRRGEPAASMPTPRPTRWRRPIPALAAAAVLTLGAAAGSLVTRTLTRDDSPPAQIVREAELTTLATKVRRGAADVVRTDSGLDLRVTTEALDPGPGYLEVWLINTDLRRMVSVGVLPSAAQAASFPVPSKLLDQGYVIVDISREALDDKPEHSGDSLLRGQL